MTQVIPILSPDLGPLERKYLLEAFDSGWIGSKGHFIDKLEEKFAKYIGVRHAITCCNGTSALTLAYLACGMGGDSTVTLPTMTFAATFNMARLVTPKIQLVPPDYNTWNMSLDGHKTDFVVGVHLYGNPCDMGLIYRDKNIFIEDCAQALGSTFKGKKVGSFGLASIFSFHSAKTMTTGEGGMVCTDDDKVATRVRELKNHCMTKPYEHTGVGFNFRMTNLQAAIGLAQLERLPDLIKTKERITKFYDENLHENYLRQEVTRKSKAVKWLNTYRHSKVKEIAMALANEGIDTRPGFFAEDYIAFPSGTTLSQSQLEDVVRHANALA